MKEIIGVTAGRIWLILGKKGEASLPQLIKLLNEDSLIVSQAIGWLAREDKIESALKAKTEYFTLTKEEREIYVKKQTETL